MSVQICICEDNEKDIKKLSEALYAYANSFQIQTYADGDCLLEDLSEHKILFDIFFLDIYMPNLNGIEVARKIRAEMKETKIIFISSSKEHYAEAYDVFAYNYLIKPLNVEKLNIILHEALNSIQNEFRKQISFSYKASNYRICCSDIMYIESKDKTINFHMMGKNTLQCYSKLDEILKQLPEEYFIRCHQSFAVNIFHVTEMSKNHFLVGSAVISISKRYQKATKDKYFAYLFTHMNGGN